MRSAAIDGLRERLDVVSHHLDVAWRRAIRWREGIGIQDATKLKPGLRRDLLDEPRIGNVLREHGSSLLLSNLTDEGGDVCGRSLGFSRNTLRGQKGYAIIPLEITEGIVRDDRHTGGPAESCRSAP